ncbi:extracellular solute-binding protein [Vallitalea pronyensis]|uniref:Extracellular solute-binding protein n=1 Tax=Vallitalea pronyensis TaxID=1348613 RepID=A0A8J8MK47_9FIRM|nr:extracellular solute-binding protein [Vallitalea pronyensis]QUI22758.1 extracellular solute-binding protein [Vallitalea pronyensis]
MKKTMLTKVVGLLLILTMLTMVACSRSDNEGKDNSTSKENSGSKDGKAANDSGTDDVSNEHITISMYNDATPPDFYPEETPIGQKILENTNVTLEIEYLVDDAETKEGLLLVSNELPDLISTRNVSKFIEAGVVVPLDDYIEKYGEDLKRVYGDDLELLRASDGHIYSISNSRGLAPWSKQPGKAMYIQQAVLQEFDYPEITTIDAYFDIIKKYQDKYPEINGQKTLGFTMLSDDWRFGIGVLGPIKFINGYQDDGEVLVDEVNGTYKSRLLYASPEAKAYFKKVNEMYLGGYFDESSFTSNYDQYNEKLTQGRVLGMHDQYWQIEQANSAILASDYPERAYVGLPILAEEGITEYYNQPTPVEASKGLMISTSCKDPERVFKFLNDLLKEENQKLNFWGEEGVEYTVADDGSFVFTDEQLALWQDDNYLRSRGVKAFDYPYPVISNLQYYSDGNIGRPNGDPDFMKASYTVLDLEVCDAYGWETLQSGFTYEPTRAYGFAWSMNPRTNNNEDATYALATAGDLMKSYVPKLILTDEGDFNSVWEEYAEKMDKINVSDYTDFIDAKIVERIEANNPSLQ